MPAEDLLGNAFAPNGLPSVTWSYRTEGTVAEIIREKIREHFAKPHENRRT